MRTHRPQCVIITLALFHMPHAFQTIMYVCGCDTMCAKIDGGAHLPMRNIVCDAERIICHVIVLYDAAIKAYTAFART